MLDDKSLASLLDAMDGIALLIDKDLVVRAYGRTNWDRSWRSFGFDDAPYDPSDRDLLLAISPGEVRDTYALLFQSVLKRKKSRITWDVHCDSAEVRRQIRLSISAIDTGTGAPAILYQSVVLNESQRPRMELYLSGATGPHLPLVTVCSVCAKVAQDIAKTDLQAHWLDPATYYRSGGTEAVMLSHGFCPSCHEMLKRQI